MNTNYFSRLTKKLGAITGIIGMTALSIPVMAQETPTTPTQTPGVQQTPTTPTQTPDVQQTPVTPTQTPGVQETPATPAETPAEATPVPQTEDAATRNIVEVASTSNSFTTLTRLIQAAGLENTLASGTYTVFAPTDQAFATSLPQGAVEFLLRPENQDLLRQVLTYHVIPREVTATQLRTGGVKTLGGGVAVRVQQGRVIVNNASVIQPNIEADNGVIHAVNRVLLPRQLRRTIATRLQAQ